MYADRIPPHDEKAEEAVLGALLVDPDRIFEMVGLLRAEDFYRERNRWVYEAMLAVSHRGDAVDEVVVAHELIVNGRVEASGGTAFLAHLVASVPTSVYAEHYAGIVKECSIMRGLIRAAAEMARMGYEQETPSAEAVRQAEDMLYALRRPGDRRDFVSLKSVLDSYLEGMLVSPSQALEAGGGPVYTGFADIDRLLGGLQPSDLIILAARPGLGKSTLALNIARNAADGGRHVGVFSLEMSAEQLALRMLAAEAEVDGHRLRLDMVTERERARVMDAIGALSDLPVYIDDTPLEAITSIRSKARRLSLEHGLDLLVVDYIQLIQASRRSGQNRVQEMGEITAVLKGVARDLRVPVLALSQLSRAVEMRPNHRPQLSDLRDSGTIEQDADVVAFIYREDMAVTEAEWERLHPSDPYPQNIAELLILKHRNGPLGEMGLYFRNQFSRFENLVSRLWDGAGV